MRTRACALALLVTLSPAMFPVGAAFADDAMTEMARQRFQEGVKFFDQKKYDEARAAFLQAYALKKHPAVLLNLAQSELRANRPADAARHFAQFLRDNPEASALEKQEAERGLAEARAKAGRIQVSVNAAGADVFVDDELVGKAPLAEPVDVAPGDRRIEAKLGDQTQSIVVKAAAGKVVEAKLNLGAGSPAGVPPVLLPPAQSAPAQESGFPAPTFGPTPMGPSAGYPETFPPEPMANADAPTQSTRREPFFYWLTHKPVAWVGMGVTAVGAGLGVYGLARASSQGSKADDLTIKIQQRWKDDAEAQAARPNGNVCLSPALVTSKSNFGAACGKLRDTMDGESAGKTLATVGFVTAGVGVAGTVVAYFLTSKKTESPTAIVTPVYGPDHAGISLTGSF